MEPLLIKTGSRITIPFDFGPSGNHIVWEDDAQYHPGEWTDPWGVGWRNGRLRLPVTIVVR